MFRTADAKLDCAVHAVAADGVHLQFAGHERKLRFLRGDGSKETGGGGKFEARAGNDVAVGAAPFDHRLGGTAPVVSNACKAHGMGDSRRQFGEALLQHIESDFLLHIFPVVEARDAEGGDFRAARFRPPTEKAGGKLLLVLLRAHHHIIFLSVGRHQLGKKGGMAKRIDIVSGLGEQTKPALEIIAPQLHLLVQPLPAGQVAVGLDVPAADDFPAPGFNMFADALEKRGIDFLDLLIHPRFAPGKDDIGVPVEEVAHAFAGVEDFIETRRPRPEPDRINVGVENEMNGFKGHSDESEFLPSLRFALSRSYARLYRKLCISEFCENSTRPHFSLRLPV